MSGTSEQSDLEADATQRHMGVLSNQLVRLETLLTGDRESWHRHAPAVSGWSVGQQVEHTLRSMRRMFAAVRLLLDGDDQRIRSAGTPNAAGQRVLRTGRIERGTAQAPEYVLPGPGPDPDGLRPLHARLVRMIDTFPAHRAAILAAPGVVPHPLLGDFDAASWVHLARVHTEHHLAIIDEILASEARPSRLVQ